jgi:hypothetical protein
MSELVDFLAEAGFEDDMTSFATVYVTETPPKKHLPDRTGTPPASSAPEAPTAPAATPALPMGRTVPAMPSETSSAVASLLASGKATLLERAKATKEDLMCSQIHFKRGIPWGPNFLRTCNPWNQFAFVKLARLVP